MKDEFKLWCMCDNDSEVFEEIKLHHYRYHENVVWWTWKWGFELLLVQNISPQIMQTLAFIHLLKYWKKQTKDLSGDPRELFILLLIISG